MSVVRVRDLVVRYGEYRAVDAVSFEARSGQVLALVGPNGAGKTTTVEACLGLREPESGSIEVLGERDLASPSLRSRVGVMLQDGGLYPTARPLDLANHIASLYPHPDDPATLLAALGLDPASRTPIRRLSGGEQQRVKCVLALIGRPELVFLDEPTVGLDTTGRHAFHRLIRALKATGTTVVLTTHLMDDVEQLADRVVVIAGGHTIAQGSISDLVGSSDSIEFAAPAGIDGLSDRLPPGCEVALAAPGRYRIDSADNPMALSAVAAWCADNGIPTSELHVGRRSLEAVVLALIGEKS